MSQLNTILELSQTFDINHIYAQRVFSQINISSVKHNVRRIINEKPKPFVKWVGGKRQLLKQFQSLNLYPPMEFNPLIARYYEPFLGGGAVFFDLLPFKATLSDLNHELVTTYNVIKTDVEKLIFELRKHKTDKDYFLRMRSLDINNLTNLQIASRFIFLNRTCFNGMYRVNKSGKFNVPYGRYSNPLICDDVNLKRVSEVLQNVQILEQDYKKVDNSAREGDFVYFDPPYFPVSKTASFTSYTNEAFLEKEQIQLRDLFVRLARRGCYVMLSNSDTPFINDIYSNLEGVKISKVYAGRAINSDSSKRGKVSEVVITSY